MTWRNNQHPPHYNPNQYDPGRISTLTEHFQRKIVGWRKGPDQITIYFHAGQEKNSG